MRAVLFAVAAFGAASAGRGGDKETHRIGGTASTVKLAQCRGPKQVKYSAAWLASRELLAGLADSYLNTTKLCRPGTMMEAASFLLLEGGRVGGGRRGAPRLTYKTLDFLDLYVEHLSWYERRLLEATKGLRDKKAAMAYGRGVYAARVQGLPAADAALQRPDPPRAAEAIIAVMPFYADGQGQGPSSAGIRAAYLNATLASIRSSLTRNVVIAVANRNDLAVALAHGPLFDVLYLPGLPDPNKLGAAALIAAHRLVTASGDRDPIDERAVLYEFDESEVDKAARPRRWRAASDLGFAGSYRAHASGDGRVPRLWRRAKYVYYTESDQILRARNVDAMAAFLDRDPENALIVPHRAVPVPVPADFPAEARAPGGWTLARRGLSRAALLATGELERNGAWGEVALDRAADTCCFASVDDACTHRNARDADDLVASTDLLRAGPGGFALVPGEGNFLRMSFRPCAHGPRARASRPC